MVVFFQLPGVHGKCLVLIIFLLFAVVEKKINGMLIEVKAVIVLLLLSMPKASYRRCNDKSFDV